MTDDDKDGGVAAAAPVKRLTVSSVGPVPLKVWHYAVIVTAARGVPLGRDQQTVVGGC